VYKGFQVKYVIFVHFKNKGYFQIYVKIPNQQILQKCAMAAMLFHADNRKTKQLFLANCYMNMPKKYIFLPAVSFIPISNFLYNLEELFFTPSAQK